MSIILFGSSVQETPTTTLWTLTLELESVTRHFYLALATAMSRTLGVARCQCCGEEDLALCLKCLTRAHQVRGNVAVVSTMETTTKDSISAITFLNIICNMMPRNTLNSKVIKKVEYLKQLTY
jgi:hypothetical protein